MSSARRAVKHRGSRLAARGSTPLTANHEPRTTNHARKGFTLIEALAGVVLLGIGIVGATTAIGTMIRTEDMMRQKEKMSRLAHDKLSELVATGQAATSSDGDFSEQNETGYTWSLESNPSGIANLDAITLTVKREGFEDEARLDSLVYVPPETATTGTGQ